MKNKLFPRLVVSGMLAISVVGATSAFASEPTNIPIEQALSQYEDQTGSHGNAPVQPRDFTATYEIDVLPHDEDPVSEFAGTYSKGTVITFVGSWMPSDVALLANIQGVPRTGWIFDIHTGDTRSLTIEQDGFYTFTLKNDTNAHVKGCLTVIVK